MRVPEAEVCRNETGVYGIPGVGDAETRKVSLMRRPLIIVNQQEDKDAAAPVFFSLFKELTS